MLGWKIELIIIKYKIGSTDVKIKHEKMTTCLTVGHSSMSLNYTSNLLV